MPSAIPATIRMPGEFEAQDSVILGWSTEEYLVKGHPLDTVHGAEVQALVGHVRTITMIDSLALNVGGGGIHCNTRDIPAAPR